MTTNPETLRTMKPDRLGKLALVAVVAAGGCSSSARQSNSVPTDELGMEVRVVRLSDTYQLLVDLRDSRSGQGLLPVPGGLRIGLDPDDELVVVSNRRTIESFDIEGTAFEIDLDELPGSVRIELRRAGGQLDALNTTFELERAASLLSPVAGSRIPVDGVLDLSWGVVDSDGNMIDPIGVRGGSVIPGCVAKPESFAFPQPTELSQSVLSSPVAIPLTDVLPESGDFRGMPCDTTVIVNFEEFDFGATVIYDDLLAPSSTERGTTGSAVYENSFGAVEVILE